jgi:hypothetical protein
MKNKKTYSRIALIVSVAVLTVWAIMGAGTSLAWFSDTDEEVRNIFNFAEFEVAVEYLDKNDDWQDLAGATQVFDDNALYEPGFAQVVYLRVTNNGTVPFEFTTAVTVSNFTTATNVFGQTFALSDHLRFGVVTADSMEALNATLVDRFVASQVADTMLGNYHETTSRTLDAGKSAYVALIVRMPEEVDDVANYRGSVIPKVELGITVLATQLKQ